MTPASALVELRRDGSPHDPARDMALTWELLQAVAKRECSTTVRVFRPGPTVAFGRSDAFKAGFDRASEAARLNGFAPLVRHGGGHAVAYNLSSVVLELIRPEDGLIGGIEPRFQELSALIRDAAGQLGLELEVGELAEEYCPGRFSLHLPNGPKVAGIAQRVIKGASLTTAVVAVGSGIELRRVTGEVYAALELPLNVSTVGAIDEKYADADAGSIAETLAELAIRRFSMDVS